MSITTLTSNESGANSLIDINANFADLDTTKADLASPTFTGTPVLPTGTTGVTQSAGDNSTKLATTAYVDAAGVSTQFSTTNVFSGTSPSSFTDLNLSSVVGVTQRIVLLRVGNNSGSTRWINVRTNGDTSNYAIAATVTMPGVEGAYLNNTYYTTLLVKTDTSGVIEWNTQQAEAGWTIDVLAYW